MIVMIHACIIRGALPVVCLILFLLSLEVVGSFKVHFTVVSNQCYDINNLNNVESGHLSRHRMGYINMPLRFAQISLYLQINQPVIGAGVVFCLQCLPLEADVGSGRWIWEDGS